MQLVRDFDVLAKLGPSWFFPVRSRPLALSPSPWDASDSLTSDLSVYPQMRHLLDHFMRRLPGRLTRLGEALAHRDGDGLRRMAMQLKQSATTHGYVPLALAAHRLVRRIDTTPLRWDRLKEAVEELNALALRARVTSGAGPELSPGA